MQLRPLGRKLTPLSPHNAISFCSGGSFSNSISMKRYYAKTILDYILFTRLQ
jgi:hypothetical protein